VAARKEHRIQTTLRMSRTEARLVKKLQELRNVTSDHAVIHAAFAKGLEVELIAEGIRLYRERPHARGGCPHSRRLVWSAL
jgi:hypothetical protein